MPGTSLGLGGQAQHVGGDGVGAAALTAAGRARDQLAQASVAVQRFGPGVLAGGRMAQRLGRVPHRRAAPVGDHVGHLGGAVPAVAAVHVLDHLLAPVALDVDVDVGRAVALGRQEPLEQQTQRHRVHVGDAQHVAHRRVGGRSPALAVDVAAAAERGDVPHHQEIARKPELLDHVELVGDLAPGARHPLGVGRAVAGLSALDGETAQEGGLVEAVGARIRGQLRRHQRQAEGALRSRAGPRPRSLRGSGRSGGPARRLSAGGRLPRQAASRCGRRGRAGRRPRPGHRPGGGCRARRSAPHWCTPAAPPGVRRVRPGHRCGGCRAGRRGPTAPRTRCLRRPRRSTGRVRPPRPGDRGRPAPRAPQPPWAPVRIAHRSRWAAAASKNVSVDSRGSPLRPAMWARLISVPSAAYPAGSRASTTTERLRLRRSDGRAGPDRRDEPGRSRVSSAPNTVGRPASSAASANRTTP